jgi:SAM-dependent methyltransferase
MLTNFQVRILKRIAPGPSTNGECDYEGTSKLAVLMGEDFFTRIAGKVVVDFGCGEGADTVEMARRGAKRVIGIDIREDVLRVARQRAIDAGVQDTCLFVTSTSEIADVVVSTNAFEHFGDPAEILKIMNTILQPTGDVFISFGPTWYHPLGGHLFSVFPWAHLIFSEKALIIWRSRFKTDGATRFGEVAGGLNQMSIAKFKEFVAHSGLKFSAFELVPIRKLRFFHNRFTREFTTSFVRCRLVKRND